MHEGLQVTYLSTWVLHLLGRTARTHGPADDGFQLAGVTGSAA